MVVPSVVNPSMRLMRGRGIRAPPDQWCGESVSVRRRSANSRRLPGRSKTRHDDVPVGGQPELDGPAAVQPADLDLLDVPVGDGAKALAASRVPAFETKLAVTELGVTDELGAVVVPGDRVVGQRAH